MKVILQHPNASFTGLSEPTIRLPSPTVLIKQTKPTGKVIPGEKTKAIQQ